MKADIGDQKIDKGSKRKMYPEFDGFLPPLALPPQPKALSPFLYWYGLPASLSATLLLPSPSRIFFSLLG